MLDLRGHGPVSERPDFSSGWTDGDSQFYAGPYRGLDHDHELRAAAAIPGDRNDHGNSLELHIDEQSSCACGREFCVYLCADDRVDDFAKPGNFPGGSDDSQFYFDGAVEPALARRNSSASICRASAGL